MPREKNRPYVRTYGFFSPTIESRIDALEKREERQKLLSMVGLAVAVAFIVYWVIPG